MLLKAQMSVTAVFLSVGLLCQAAPAHSSQKMADISRYSEMMSEIGSLSPSELSLMELQREREDLLRDRSKENPRIFQNKLTILNNKITYLQGEIRRMKPYVVRTRLVPLKDKPPVRPAARPAPVEVALKEAAPAARQPLSPASPAPVETKGPAQAAERRMIPETLPVAVHALPSSGPDPRAALLPAPAPASSAAQLRTRAKKAKTAKTGADWKAMSRDDKEIYILSVMGSLTRRDVYLMKPYSFYIDTIDQAVEKNAALEEESIHHILMMTAYDFEPDTRKDLEKVWK